VNEITIKEQLLSMSLKELMRVIDIIRSRTDIASIEVLTETDLLEMAAEDSRHFRNLVHAIRKDTANEPA
jgi:hypothetical protein